MAKQTFFRPAAAAAALAATAFLTGCGSITGLMDAHDAFGCPIGTGINCTTLSQTYARENALAESAQRPQILSKTEAPSPKAGKPARLRPGTRQEGLRHLPTLSARAPERVLLLWVLPWVDERGDLHDASRVWMRVEDASWRIERVRTKRMRTAAPEMEP